MTNFSLNELGGLDNGRDLSSTACNVSLNSLFIVFSVFVNSTKWLLI